MKQETEKTTKLRILFRGWRLLQHSYGQIMAFKLVHLWKNYKDKIQFYVEEMPYFREDWRSKQRLVYSEEYNKILKELQEWKGEPIDLIYSVTYPYNIIVNSNSEVSSVSKIPKCVFYTSEFARIDHTYFCLDGHKFSNDDQVSKYIELNKNSLWFTSPSEWSSRGITRFGVPTQKNRIITHGVDNTIFKRLDDTRRKKIRGVYGVKDDEILLMNIGAMTGNKGILLILQALNFIVNKLNKRNYKILLKGTGDLYQSKEFLEMYFEEMQRNSVLTKDEMNNLLTNHIIFVNKTLSYSNINDLFNAADLYLSPYLAEGFNLTSLEALASGLRVLVPVTGSTKQYMNDIFMNGGEDFIIYVNSREHHFDNGNTQNIIDINDLISVIINNEYRLKQRVKVEDYTNMKGYIESDYSWNAVSKMLWDYFNYIVNNNKLDNRKMYDI